MNYSIVAVVLASALAIGLVNAGDRKLWDFDLSDSEYERCEKFVPYFVEIGDVLFEKSLEYPGWEEIMKQSKELLEESNKPKLLGGGAPADLDLEGYQEALKLLVSLEKADGKQGCGMESFKILACNYMATGGKELLWSAARPRSPIDHYRSAHGDNCMPIYQRQFAEQVKLIDKKDLKRVEKAFETITLLDYDYKSAEWIKAFSRKAIKLSEDSRRVERIAHQVRKQVGIWKLSESRLDRYLFKPCENYRNQLAHILSPALFDILYQSSWLRNIFARDGDAFHRAVQNNVFCASVLAERKKLYGLLIKASA